MLKTNVKTRPVREVSEICPRVNGRIYGDRPKKMLEDLVGQRIIMREFRVVQLDDEEPFLVILCQKAGREFRLETSAKAIVSLLQQYEEELPLRGTIVRRPCAGSSGWFYFSFE